MKALDYILANYQQGKYKVSRAERAVLRALVHSLNKEELLILQKKLKRGSSKWSVGKGLYEEAIKVLGKIQPHRNESISALLKAFTDKQSGLVAETRAELRDRFGKQSFLTQRKRLKACFFEPELVVSMWFVEMKFHPLQLHLNFTTVKHAELSPVVRVLHVLWHGKRMLAERGIA